MGCTSSKGVQDPAQLTGIGGGAAPAGTTSAAASAKHAAAEEAAEQAEAVMEDWGDALEGVDLDSVDPTQFAEASSALATAMAGIKIEAKLTLPLDLIGRCLANVVVYWTKDTDIGAMISKATEAATTRIEDGIDVLRDEPLFTAADKLKPLLLDLQLLEDETDQGRLGRFVQDAMVVYHTADKAFNTVKTVPAKIRAVKIACIAIAATDVADNPDDTKDEQRIRNHLGCQIQKLWTRVPKVQQEVAASLGSTRSSVLCTEEQAGREGQARGPRTS